MPSQLPDLKNARLNQIVGEDIPWRFRAAKALGTNALNLSGEIEDLISRGALLAKNGQPTKITRRCETDAIEFGAYASIRWLLELLEIKFYSNGEQQKYKKNDPNIWLRDLSAEANSAPLEIAKIEKEFQIDLKKEYGILSAHGSHPSKSFDAPRIDPDRIDKLLALIECLLIKYIYKTPETFRGLWFRASEGDPGADRPRVNFNP